MNPLIGKVITNVWLAKDKRAIKFDIENEDSIIARADGDCCSVSWIEEIDLPSMLIGKVISVEDINMPDLGQPNEYDLIQYYGCKITTDKGSCIIDYRNESNGYYGGNLSWPNDRSSFYGGVYGQNISQEDWQPLLEAK